MEDKEKHIWFIMSRRQLLKGVMLQIAVTELEKEESCCESEMENCVSEHCLSLCVPGAPSEVQ